MKRRLINLLTLLSLVLFVAAVWLWLRGYSVVDVAAVTTFHERAGDAFRDEWKAMSGKGVVAVVWQRDTSGASGGGQAGGPRLSHFTMPPSNFAVGTATISQRLGFNWIDHVYRDPTYPTSTRRTRGVRVPYWIIALTAGLLPAWRLPRELRALRAGRKRAAAGRCQECGYDLRATPGRCPECGKVEAEAVAHPVEVSS